MYCECGCGQTTSVVDRNRPDRGLKKGDHYRFAYRHRIGITPSTETRTSISTSLTQHGHAKKGHKSRLYNVWSGMKNRCLNPDSRDYEYYGGRGIKICERWLSFENFMRDMGVPPKGMSIDRYPDLNGNYEPGNCRWATITEQNRNRRCSTNVEWEGTQYPISELATKFGLTYATLKCRLRRGIELNKALEMPYDKRRIATSSGSVWKSRILCEPLGS